MTEARRAFYAIQAEQAIGAFMVEKFRKQAQESGLEVAAKNARKQGIPVRVVAMMWSAIRPEKLAQTYAIEKFAKASPVMQVWRDYPPCKDGAFRHVDVDANLVCQLCGKQLPRSVLVDTSR